MPQTCCVTGHRKIPIEKQELVEQALREEIHQAVQDGFTHFVSGFAEGTDLLFASIVAELMNENPDLSLEAAIPYRQRLIHLAEDNKTRDLLFACNVIGVHSEAYSSNSFFVRNRFMVKISERVIAVYDGRDRGGTVSTMRFAHSLQRELKTIHL